MAGGRASRPARRGRCLKPVYFKEHFSKVGKIGLFRMALACLLAWRENLSQWGL